MFFFKRYFLEAKKYPLVVVMYIFSAFFFVFFYAFLFMAMNPVVELSAMDEVKGEVIGVTGRNPCGKKLYLNVDGVEKKYRACLTRDEAGKLIGKGVVVWSQKMIGGVFYRYNRVHQIKVGDDLFKVYTDEIFERSVRNHKVIEKTLKFLFFLFFMPLVVVWVRMRKVCL